MGNETSEKTGSDVKRRVQVHRVDNSRRNVIVKTLSQSPRPSSGDNEASKGRVYTTITTPKKKKKYDRKDFNNNWARQNIFFFQNSSLKPAIFCVYLFIFSDAENRQV